MSDLVINDSDLASLSQTLKDTGPAIDGMSPELDVSQTVIGEVHLSQAMEEFSTGSRVRLSDLWDKMESVVDFLEKVRISSSEVDDNLHLDIRDLDL